MLCSVWEHLWRKCAFRTTPAISKRCNSPMDRRLSSPHTSPKKGLRKQSVPATFVKVWMSKTEQIAKGGEKIIVHSGLRISVYDQATRAAPVHLFHYGERLRFPAKLSPPATSAIRVHSTTGVTRRSTASSRWRPSSRRALKFFPGFPAARLNSGAHGFIAASSKKCMPYGRRAKPR